MSQLLLDNKKYTGDFLISFVIPTYKNRIYLEKAIDSIINQKNNCDLNYEIVVTSNFSDDNMIDLIEKYQHASVEIRLFRNEINLGQVGNINQGVMLSRGKYIAFLHDDDMILPNYLETISSYISGTNKFDCIIPSMYIMKNDYFIDLKHRLASCIFSLRFLYRRPLQRIRKEDHLLAYDNVYSAPTCGTIFLKEKLTSYGLFKDEHGAAWDYFNYRQFHNNYNIYLLHKYIGVRREYTGMSNETKVQKDFELDRISMIEHEFANYKFIRANHDTILNKQPYFKYLWFKFRTRIYFYLHNLDSKIGIPKRLYKIYSD